jgi:hypothetical protein
MVANHEGGRHQGGVNLDSWKRTVVIPTYASRYPAPRLLWVDSVEKGS